MSYCLRKKHRNYFSVQVTGSLCIQNGWINEDSRVVITENSSRFLVIEVYHVKDLMRIWALWPFSDQFTLPVLPLEFSGLFTQVLFVDYLRMVGGPLREASL